jgi:hypothetical protein
MRTANLLYSTIIDRYNKVLNKYSFELETKIEGIKCKMQLDSGFPFTCLTDTFIKKNKLFTGKVISFKNFDPKLTFDGCYSHIRNVLVNVKGLGKMVFPKCYIEIIKTQKELNKLKDVSESQLPFAGYLGFDFLMNKIFEVNYRKNLLVFYSSHKELPVKYNKISYNDFIIEKNSILLPVSVNNQKVYALYDTGSSRFTIILSNDLFRKITNTPLNKLRYIRSVRPDFITRTYYLTKKLELSMGSMKLNSRIELYTPSVSYNEYSFPANFRQSAILGNELFNDKIIIFNTITKKFAITS